MKEEKKQFNSELAIFYGYCDSDENMVSNVLKGNFLFTHLNRNKTKL